MYFSLASPHLIVQSKVDVIGSSLNFKIIKPVSVSAWPNTVFSYSK